MAMAARIPTLAHPPLERADQIEVAPPRRRSAWRRLGWTGTQAIVFLVCLVVVAIVGPGVWPWGALEQHMDALLQDPSLSHPLGTDEFGRDILARLLLGARWSLAGAAIICAGTSALGFFIAALAVMGDRRVDATIGRAIEAMMALPGL